MRVVKRSWSDSLVYAGLCIASLGIIYLIRIIITMAIRCAFENEITKKDAPADSLLDKLSGNTLSKKEARKLKKNYIIKVTPKDGFWTCPSCSETNREIYDVCELCEQEVEKIKGNDSADSKI